MRVTLFRIRTNEVIRRATLLVLGAAIPIYSFAQWIELPLPGTPRTADGSPDLLAPVPRTENGRPDLSGIWRVVRGANAPPPGGPPVGPGRIEYFMSEDAEIPLRPHAAAIYEERSAALGFGRPSQSCLPHGIPDAMMYGGPMKIVRTDNLTVILFEEFTNYRQIHTDGRSFPEGEVQPTWLGYSIGHWEGDTFVVETMGFNNRTWMDDSGLPHSEALRTVERFQRIDFGHMNLQVIFDDPEMYTQPWSVDFSFDLWPDTELIEHFCENEKYG